ncbi:hypothetical protein KKC45_00805 [Patescibacteria group bacterium]|nr:hypothetical protein [Patescibacteria group bacterium]
MKTKPCEDFIKELIMGERPIPELQTKFSCRCGKTLAKVFSFGSSREDRVYVVYNPHIKITCGVYVKCNDCGQLKSTEEIYPFCLKCYEQVHENLMKIFPHLNQEGNPQPELGYFTTITSFSPQEEMKLLHQGGEDEFKKILLVVRNGH